MEGGEIEMTIEELQRHIRGIVKTRLISTDTAEKCKLLQSLLEKKEKQSAHLLKLYQSVAECEAIVKKQYSLLGWEYKDADSDDDDAAADKTYLGNTSPSPCDVSQVPSFSTPNECSPLSPKLENSENVGRDIIKQISQLKKQPVVILTRIPLTKIRSLCPPRPSSHYSEDEPLNPPTPKKCNSEDEFFNLSTPRKQDSESESTDCSDSEKPWEPDYDSSDSDFSISNYNSGSNKRRKMNQKNETNAKSHETQQANRETVAMSKLGKIFEPQTSAKNNAKSHETQQANRETVAMSKLAKIFEPQTSAKNNAKSHETQQANRETGAMSKLAKIFEPQTSAKNNAKSHETQQANRETGAMSKQAKIFEPQTSAKNNAKSHETQQANRETGAMSKQAKIFEPQTSAKNNAKSNRMPENTNDISPASTVTTLPQSSTGATKTLKPLSVPQEKISVNMNVLARESAMNWKWGKVVEIVAKEDCRLKFMVSFKEEGQSLVSGHHIAFDTIPKADQLIVGARVVVKCQAEKVRYCPGFVAEFPCRKNRMRFLVFMDDHTPIYVGLPSLHLVCKPLADPFEDILDEIHRDFMKEYVNVWPNPPQTNYKVGQKVDAELNGVQQTCEVKVVDCSLVQVFFPKTQQTEWIYRGSIRLKHMFQLRKKLEMRRAVNQKKVDLQIKIDSS